MDRRLFSQQLYLARAINNLEWGEKANREYETWLALILLVYYRKTSRYRNKDDPRCLTYGTFGCLRERSADDRSGSCRLSSMDSTKSDKERKG